VISILVIGVWGTANDIMIWLREIELSIPVPLFSDINLNLMDLLQGVEIIEAIEGFAELTWMQIIGRILSGTIIAGILAALAAFFCGGIFNLLALVTGGMKVSLKEGAVEIKEFKNQPTVQPKKQPQITGPRLEITSPVQRVFPVASHKTLIGSSPECALQLDDLQPNHALLSYEAGRYLLQDYSQGNTQVQGRVINGVNMVKDGFLIQIGPYKMTFRY